MPPDIKTIQARLKREFLTLTIQQTKEEIAFDTDWYIAKIKLLIVQHLSSSKIQESVAFPADWWQAFRQRWFPKRWIRRHPIRYRYIEQIRNYYRCCPHLTKDSLDKHLSFLTPYPFRELPEPMLGKQKQDPLDSIPYSSLLHMCKCIRAEAKEQLSMATKILSNVTDVLVSNAPKSLNEEQKSYVIRYVNIAKHKLESLIKYIQDW